MTEKDYSPLLMLLNRVHDRGSYACLWLLRSIPGVRNVLVEEPVRQIRIYVQVEQDFEQDARLLGETMREVHRRAAFCFVDRMVYDRKSMPYQAVRDYPGFVVVQAWALPPPEDHEMHQLGAFAEEMGIVGQDILEFNDELSRCPSHAFNKLFDHALRVTSMAEAAATFNNDNGD